MKGNEWRLRNGSQNQIWRTEWERKEYTPKMQNDPFHSIVSHKRTESDMNDEDLMDLKWEL